MPQTTILAAGTAAGTSSNVTVAAGASAIISAFVAAGKVPPSVELGLYMATPGADAFVANLGEKPTVIHNPTTTPVVYRVKRENIASNGTAVGAVAIT